MFKIFLDKETAYSWQSTTFKCLNAVNSCTVCTDEQKDTTERFWMQEVNGNRRVDLDHYQRVLLFFLALGGHAHGPDWHGATRGAAASNSPS